MTKISIAAPAYNEEKSLLALLPKLRDKYQELYFRLGKSNKK